jgi:phytoene dehydrogenase-like protein
VLAPDDVEDHGLTGAALSGRAALQQLFFLRPVPRWARYRTPIEGYWQCGAGTHPGGGIMGASGQLAAQAILEAAR